MGNYDFELKESSWNNYVTSEHANIGDTVDHHYGMTCAIITDEDIEALQNGKVIIYDVEGEYRIAIKMGEVDNDI